MPSIFRARLNGTTVFLPVALSSIRQENRLRADAALIDRCAVFVKQPAGASGVEGLGSRETKAASLRACYPIPFLQYGILQYGKITKATKTERFLKA
jgi:hypothetical protein